MVNEYFRKYDGLFGCTNTIPKKDNMKEEFYDINENLDELARIKSYLDDKCNDDNVENIEILLKEAITPIFKNKTTNQLQTNLMFLNICIIFGVPNTHVDELLKILKHDLFPKIYIWF